MSKKLMYLVSFVLLLSLTSGQGILAGQTFTVTNTNDSGTGSLRQAIESANANLGLDVIAFNIPAMGRHPGTDPRTIQPTSPLPHITDPVIIDGYTQPGAAPATDDAQATLLIELDGIKAGDGFVSGLIISAGNSTVRGLVINRFGDVGIHIQENGGNIIEGNYIGTDVTGTVDRGNFDDGIRIWNAPGNTVGGTTAEARNVVSGNNDMGVEIILSGATGNKVQGNYIGTDVTGTADLGNSTHGVFINASSNTIGGSSSGTGNVISGNGGAGITIHDIGATENQILGNYIGTDVNGTTPLGNGDHGVIILDAPNNTIGGTTREARNVISGNGGAGIEINGVGVTGNQILGNFIGTDASRRESLGNTSAGVRIISCSDNTLTDNTVSNNGYGIQLQSSSDNQIYNNNFIDNTIQSYATAGRRGNIFNLDKPIGGNYWSDWTRPDANGDGFVDDHYVFTVGVDYLPWARQDGWLLTLSVVLDTALSFTTGGSADWFGQTTTSYDGENAAQSGDISHNQESWMQTTVTGPSTVTFYWKVSSEAGYDFLEFYIDGSLEDQISGSVDGWQQKTYTISTSGSHTLEWRYVKDKGTDSGSDCGWVDKLEWMPTPPPPPTLSEGLDTALSFTAGGSANWFGQTTTSYYGQDAAQSGGISHNQESWMQTTVSGEGTVKFYWKVSSEEDFDFLEFYIDGEQQDQISGSVNWQEMMYTLTTSGSHTLEWRYLKDKGTDSGSDCGWVDKLEWVPPPPPPPDPLSEALDTDLSFTTGGSADWFDQTATFYNDGDSAQSGDISGDQSSRMQTTVSGKGTVKFYWKVSSEEDFDFLEFYIDGSLEGQISGSVNWQQKTCTISTSGSHTLEWRYMKDGATSFGSDCAWVDKVEWITTP
jgi:parallel beta-helix repeat protein